jgi:hypothetical protein
MQIMILYRGDIWYPVEYPLTYSDWAAEAERNPGTTKTTNWQGETLWHVQPVGGL